MKAKNITVELLVDNMEKSLGFYIDLLGFKISMAVPEDNPFFAILTNNLVEIMLYEREKFTEEIPSFVDKKTGGTIALYVGVEDIKDLYSVLKDKVEIIQDIHDTNYGSTEFSFYDVNGYVIMLHE